MQSTHTTNYTDQAATIHALMDNIRKAVVIDNAKLELMLAALLANGHVLLEDLPGIGKTLVAKAIARSMHASFKRIQCTPDLLPSDITGSAIYNQREQAFEFMPGPIFANIVLVDEINRASPRTQSSLLEAMAEGQVTSDGFTHELPRPFFIIATQSPSPDRRYAARRGGSRLLSHPNKIIDTVCGHGKPCPYERCPVGTPNGVSGAAYSEDQAVRKSG